METKVVSGDSILDKVSDNFTRMGSEKGNRVLAKRHNVSPPPPLGFWITKRAFFGRYSFHRHSRLLYIQQQTSSSSSNRFIEHDVSTRKLGPALTYTRRRPSFLVETFCSIKRLLEDEELCCWTIFLLEQSFSTILPHLQQLRNLDTTFRYQGLLHYQGRNVVPNFLSGWRWGRIVEKKAWLG